MLWALRQETTRVERDGLDGAATKAHVGQSLEEGSGAQASRFTDPGQRQMRMERLRVHRDTCRLESQRNRPRQGLQ